MKQETTNGLSENSSIRSAQAQSEGNGFGVQVPEISLPKGGGAVRGIDEKFSVNSFNGTMALGISIPLSGGRGITPSLGLSYNSGNGNGAFGLGWSLSLSGIRRKTDNGLPQYLDGIDSDTFVMSGAEDLVPRFKTNPDGSFVKSGAGDYVLDERNSPDNLFTIRIYLPRIEGGFLRIERWLHKTSGEIKWRVVSPTNEVALYGWTSQARLSDPMDSKKIFEWLPEFQYDDKGNCCRYIYKKEDEKGVDTSKVHNKNRLDGSGKITYTNSYIEKVLYSNKTPYFDAGLSFPPDEDFLFSVVFDYGEYESNGPFGKIKDWEFRKDPFSEYRSGFYHQMPSFQGKGVRGKETASRTSLYLFPPCQQRGSR